MSAEGYGLLSRFQFFRWDFMVGLKNGTLLQFNAGTYMK